MRFLISSLCMLVFTACAPIFETPDTDLRVATANILINNKENIETDLLNKDCDIYLLHEAVVGVNINPDPFIEEGYKIHSHTKSSNNAFNGVLITKMEGEFQSIDLNYSYGGFDPVYVSPFYRFSFTFNQRSITVIGTHIPPEIFMPEEFKELRQNAIQDICKDINNGKDSMGREVILAGDFNTHPSDDILDPILTSSLEDAMLYSNNRYQKTWKPNISPIDLARIDYIFVSNNLITRYLDSFPIAGSDHNGLITGIDIE